MRETIEQNTNDKKMMKMIKKGKEKTDRDGIEIKRLHT